ncbi:MAG: DUF348 domain-containing protein [Chloroflexi bacterium]|nr:DUF348 domain-containing protein [Chloroflexota bacterium]
MASVLIYPSATVAISVEGRSFQMKTRVGKVETVLREAGIQVEVEDIVSPPLNARVNDGDAIVIKKPTASLLLALPDKTFTARTAAETIKEALDEKGIPLTPDDVVTRDGMPASLNDPLIALPAPVIDRSPYVSSTLLRPYGFPSYRGGHRPVEPSAPATVTVQIRRPVPVNVHEGELTSVIYTLEETLAQALDSAGISLDPVDHVTPDLETAARSGMHVYIYRSRGVTIDVDGAERTVRTFSETVGDVLAENGIKLGNLDQIDAELDSYAHDGKSVKITRVAHELVTEEEAIPYRSETRADPDLEIDRREVAQVGKPGLFKRTTRVIYKDGEEVERILEREWVDYEAQTHINAYGTKIVVRELDTPAGPISYWRKLRVYATAYDARGGGKPKGSPGYGITSTGMTAGYGVIAVDPSVIPYYTRMYVPGYGVGIAGDTGGGVRGRFIDLGYEEGEISWGQSRYVDIYLLAPPTGNIRWILP